MLFTNTVFIGIDPTAGKRPFVYAALDRELNLIAVDHGSIDEVLAFTAAHNQAFVGVCAPKRPNQRLMADDQFRQDLNPVPVPGRWIKFRVADYFLRQHNIRTTAISDSGDECPGWMQMGFHLYNRLDDIGYSPYPHEEAERQFAEVYPHASFTALLGRLPFQKISLEGRIQRQLSLYEQRIRIPDPMRIFEEITRFKLLNGILPTEDLYSHEELDALVAAFTVWYGAVYPNRSQLIGEPGEGQVLLPVKELKERYL